MQEAKARGVKFSPDKAAAIANAKSILGMNLTTPKPTRTVGKKNISLKLWILQKNTMLQLP